MKTAILITCFVAAGAVAQEIKTKHTLRLVEGAATASIDDLAWLQGYWVGAGLGGSCEEMWGAPQGGAMLGTFRLMREGKLEFSEFFILAEEDGIVSLKLKHFDAKFAGWEEKDKFVEFKFIKLEGKTAYFDGLTYELGQDGKLRAYVAMKKKDGTFGEGVLTFERK